jgi:hypothetical protein
MKLHKYKTYQEYIDIQIRGNKANPDGQWCEEKEIEFLSNYLLKNYNDIKFGICHGCKQGNEQKWFNKYTKAHVIGTDITDIAEIYPNTICWDFHDVKPEWISNVDFIYSNAFDHSPYPHNCLKAWMSCVKNRGCCILEWSTGHSAAASSKLDPFGASLEEYQDLIVECGFLTKDILKIPTELRGEKTFLIIGH